MLLRTVFVYSCSLLRPETTLKQIRCAVQTGWGRPPTPWGQKKPGTYAAAVTSPAAPSIVAAVTSPTTSSLVSASSSLFGFAGSQNRGSGTRAWGLRVQVSCKQTLHGLDLQPLTPALFRSCVPGRRRETFVTPVRVRQPQNVNR